MRQVACGQCDACCRNDCGTCLNCLDKPKFGGTGIRKQSCLERKCRQPVAAPIPGSTVGPAGGDVVLASTLSKSSAIAPPAAEARNSMPPQEWEAFSSAVECIMLLQGGHGTPSVDETARGLQSVMKASAQRGRTNRCGTCAGCVRGDCGACKNCKDKPKFGGKGIKKQACVRRACNNPLPEGAAEDEQDDYEVDEPLVKTARVLAASGPGGFLSAETSPTHAPAYPSGGKFAPTFDLAESSRPVVKTQVVSGDGSCGMLQDTRRRLQQLREADGAYQMPLLQDRPSSSMSTGYSTADEYEVHAAEPGEDPSGSEPHSAAEDDDTPSGTPEHVGASGFHGQRDEALLVALAAGRVHATA
mmetsp:Transcript_30585/g.79412  ORF Transcript_30585/g.79412 Transcript_30585/m.79412 type:complete len:359 (-) Transcript_30585:428-1504(-)